MPAASTSPLKQPGRTCPNCATFVPQGRSQCGKCKLEVNKMNAFAAAKAAAERKGLRETEVDAPPRSSFLRPGPIIAIMVVLALIVAISIKLGVGQPVIPPWSKFPLTRETLARQFLAGIATGQDAGYLASYRLIAPSAKNPKSDDEEGLYRQIFHNLNRYLSGEFGDGWDKNAQVIEDPANPDTLTIKVELETLHLTVEQQTPADQVATAGQHYAVVRIDEFPINEAYDAQKQAALMGILGGLGGQGAVNNLNIIIGGTPNARLSKMQRKYLLLPILRDPRQTIRRTILHTWPLRQDPVVRARLQQITTDGRFASDIQRTAKEVLDERVDETDLIAAGVPDQ